MNKDQVVRQQLQTSGNLRGSMGFTTAPKRTNPVVSRVNAVIARRAEMGKAGKK